MYIKIPTNEELAIEVLNKKVKNGDTFTVVEYEEVGDIVMVDKFSRNTYGLNDRENGIINKEVSTSGMIDYLDLLGLTIEII